MSTKTNHTITLVELASKITLCMDLVTLIFGTLGCIGSIITYSSRQMRQSSTVIYLLYAAASQLATILVCVGTRLSYDHSGSNLLNESTAFCKSRYYFAIALPSIATYYMFLAALDRLLCTSENVNTRAWSQVNIAKRMAPAFLIVGLVAPIHVLIFIGIYQNECQISPGSLYTYVYAGYLAIFAILLPDVFMLIFSLMTMMAVRRVQQRVLPAVPRNHRPNERRAFELNLIKIIIVQVLINILLSISRFGSAIYLSIPTAATNSSVYGDAAKFFTLNFVSSFYFLNYATSFYSSILASRFFRNAFYNRIVFFYRRCMRRLERGHVHH